MLPLLLSHRCKLRNHQNSTAKSASVKSEPEIREMGRVSYLEESNPVAVSSSRNGRRHLKFARRYLGQAASASRCYCASFDSPLDQEAQNCQSEEARDGLCGVLATGHTLIIIIIMIFIFIMVNSVLF